MTHAELNALEELIEAIFDYKTASLSETHDLRDAMRGFLENLREKRATAASTLFFAVKDEESES